MKNGNIVVDKAKAFAIRIVRLYQYLSTNKRELVMSKQLLRSGTSIGANLHEAVEAFSKADFLYKASIALKEARETSYWLELLFTTNYIDAPQYKSINGDCEELIKLLSSIVKTAKTATPT